MGNVYKRLVEALDTVSFGFPKTWFGIERLGLKRLFSKEEAETFIAMKSGYQTPDDFASRNGISVDVAAKRLDGMAKKGLLYRRRRDGNAEYRQMPFAFGFVEFQVANPDRSWLLPIGLWSMLSSYSKRKAATMPFYRTIPIKTEMVKGSSVLPYDDLDALLGRHDRFVVAPCVCRKMAGAGEGTKHKCQHKIETCIVTDDMADFYLENGWGRKITREETATILREGDSDCRIIQVANSGAAENICSCCACGCGMLSAKKKFPGPSDRLWSNYYAVVDNTTCVLCGTCEKRCGFGAVSKVDGKIAINIDNCLGCGLCVSTCGSKSLSLVRKPDAQLYEPPPTLDAAMEKWEAWHADNKTKGIKD